jgi:hypothetical protein
MLGLNIVSVSGAKRSHVFLRPASTAPAAPEQGKDTFLKGLAARKETNVVVGLRRKRVVNAVIAAFVGQAL